MMIDAAAKQRREGGVFELRWTTGTVTVAMGLKIISSPESGNDDPEPPAPGQRFKGMQLPETVVGAGIAAGGATAVAAMAAAGTTP